MRVSVGGSPERLPRGLDAGEKQVMAAVQSDGWLEKRFGWLEDPEFRGELALRLGDLLGLSAAGVVFLREFARRPDSEIDASGDALLDSDREPMAQLVTELVPALRRHAIRPELFGLDEATAARVATALRTHGEMPELHPDVRRATANSDATEITRLLGLLPSDMRRRMFGTANRVAISVAVQGLLSLMARERQQEEKEQRQRDAHRAELDREAAAELRRQNRTGMQKVLSKALQLVIWLVAAAMMVAAVWLVYLLVRMTIR